MVDVGVLGFVSWYCVLRSALGSMWYESLAANVVSLCKVCVCERLSVCLYIWVYLLPRTFMYLDFNNCLTVKNVLILCG